MKILAIGRDVPLSQEEDFAPYLEAEALKAWELQQEGFIREIYFQADENNAVLILEATDVQHAQTMLNKLPLVKHQLIEFTLIPLKAYPGFKRLFKKLTGRNEY